MAARKPFKPKPSSFLDAARRDWQFDTFAWLLRNTGGFPKFAETMLVLPIDEHFPDRGLHGHAAVSALFRRVREHAGMNEWPSSVEPQSSVRLVSTGQTAATPIIRYDPDMLDPGSLVAVFARELASYLVESFEERAPGGEPLQEPATDLAAVFMGFGLFMANSAFQTPHRDAGGWQGWRPRADGFLNEGELAHALAIFCLLRRMPPDSIDRHLNPHLRKYLRMATRDLSQYEARFQRLRSIFAVIPLERDERTLPTRV